MPPPRRLGSDAEDRAADYLLALGWTILGRRLKMPHGELDIVALDGDTLVIVEVKSRSRGNPSEFVTPKKQEHLMRAAREFLHRQDLPEDHVIRFDVVTYAGTSMQHHRGALTSDQ